MGSEQLAFYLLIARNASMAPSLEEAPTKALVGHIVKGIEVADRIGEGDVIERAEIVTRQEMGEPDAPHLFYDRNAPPPIWATVNQPTPEWSVVDLDGNAVDSTDSLTSVMCITFIQLDSKPSMKALDAIEELQARRPEHGLTILVVAAADPQENVRELVEQRGYGFRMVGRSEEALAMARSFRVTDVPVTWLLGRGGYVADRLTEVPTLEQLEDALLKLGVSPAGG